MHLEEKSDIRKPLIPATESRSHHRSVNVPQKEDQASGKEYEHMILAQPKKHEVAEFGHNPTDHNVEVNLRKTET